THRRIASQVEESGVRSQESGISEEAAGGVLTAKQAPRRPGTAPALGLRAERCFSHGTADRPMRGELPMTRRTCLSVEALEDRTTPSTLTVLNLNDSGVGSLRQAILDANVAPGTDVIDFAPRLSGIVTLAGELSITDDLTIDGPGEGKLTISGNLASRVVHNA